MQLIKWLYSLDENSLICMVDFIMLHFSLLFLVQTRSKPRTWRCRIKQKVYSLLPYCNPNKHHNYKYACKSSNSSTSKCYLCLYSFNLGFDFNSIYYFTHNDITVSQYYYVIFSFTLIRLYINIYINIAFN